MKEYGNKYIAEVGYILIASNGQRGFALVKTDGVTYTEKKIDLQSGVSRPYGDVSFGGVINFNKATATKKNLIGKIWSIDDQIAIILNKDLDNAHLEQFNFMQSWRAWLSELVTAINKVA